MLQFRVAVAKAYPHSSGYKAGPTRDRTLFRHRGHSHPHLHAHSDWDSKTHQFISREEPECPEKTQAGMRRTCKLHRDSGPSQESTVFSSTL